MLGFTDFCILLTCLVPAPNTTKNSTGNPIIGIRLSGRGCSTTSLLPSTQSVPNISHPTHNLSSVSHIHLRPLSADPSPLILAKFISRDRQGLKGKADWTEPSYPAVFLLISGGKQQLSVSSQSLAGIPADSCCVRGEKKIVALHLKTS